jgi:hypothetical protein
MPISAWFALASGVLAGVSFLFLLLPCFWFLALPVSGLASGTGAVGLLVAVRRRESVLWAAVGLGVSLLMLALGVLLVVAFQLHLGNALKNIR